MLQGVSKDIHRKKKAVSVFSENEVLFNNRSHTEGLFKVLIQVLIKNVFLKTPYFDLHLEKLWFFCQPQCIIQ